MKKKIVKIYSHDIGVEADYDAFQFTNGRVIHIGESGESKTFAKIVERIVMFPINLPENEVGGLESTAFFEAEKPMICFNADCCKVEVNLETGDFEIIEWLTSEDVGTVINPMIVDGQMQGAIVQGISNAVFEQFVYDEDGMQMSTNFENYK